MSDEAEIRLAEDCCWWWRRDTKLRHFNASTSTLEWDGYSPSEVQAIRLYELAIRYNRGEHPPFVALDANKQAELIRCFQCFEPDDGNHFGAVLPCESGINLPDWRELPRWLVNLKASNAKIFEALRPWIDEQRDACCVPVPRGIKPGKWRQVELLDIGFAKDNELYIFDIYSESERPDLADARAESENLAKYFADYYLPKSQ